MPEEKSLSSLDNTGKIKKLTLPDGFRVGILNLDSILREVADLKLADTKTIKEELIKRLKVANYVPSGAETDYSTALFREYQHHYEPDKFKGEKVARHQHTKG